MNWENLRSPDKTTFKKSQNLFANWEKLGSTAKCQTQKIPIFNL